MRPLNWIQWVTVAMVVAMAIIVPINFVQLNHNARYENKLASKAALAAKQATQALCILRHNYLDQYRATVKYLAQHPDGAPSIGLSAASLKQSADKELAQYKALNSVRC